MENNSNNLNQANTPVVNYNAADDEIDLRELFTAIWQGKWVIIAITTLFAVTSVFYAINQPNIYKSEALLAPAEQDNGRGLTSQLGGLASLAGVNLGSGGGVDKTLMALEVLKSRQFISEFIQKHNILPELMAAKAWNREKNTIVYDDELYDAEQNKWVRAVKKPRKKEPSMQEAYKEFSKILTAEIDKESGFITVSVENLSPYIAQKWVGWLVEDINRTMKSRDVVEANKSTEFLTKQLEKTKITDIRAILYRLIEEQAKIIMFANVRDEYVFKTIDPAIIAEQKSKPRRAIICILGTFLGGALGIIYVLFGHYLRKN
ncbi:Wzz/FepE/Etk N-terminal domain-containing protein [Pseudoalteromonas issachenkonii]|uniref:Wzz/FepE/Etk N-terminal domain-containing protein n=1 Tax=Pseudoalteromonas issachenkonii TaxID=152297 RepID=UPI000C53F6BF|nr:Wzz/FepE/Etk N-terminal domain-containing protein [Pseudoalteromonas issachenkonii]MAY60546.1 LPS O-antigen length regulator [Pseudoalteromonas sp.]|tara:strand:- start:2269 stop:3225 length:957 start_codon:yes stop_codon:yes gene_type:complete